MEKNNLLPFIKWVGGKRQLLEPLRLFVSKNINKYYEPFLGGGALFLDTLPQNAILSDSNKELITTWNVIKNNLNNLTKILNKYVKLHNQDAENFYYNMRGLNPDTLNEIEIAARFIYLNKTCFNGLYRVNKDNIFNTPFNKKTTITESTLYNINNLKYISEVLNKNNVDIINEDFEKVIQNAKEGDFIFIDPPYDFDDSGFDSYTANGFGKEGQIRLSNSLIEASKRGVKFVLTNHDTKLINELYKEFKIYKIPVNRFINSDSSNRINSTFETIITNKPLNEEKELELDRINYFKELISTSYILKNYVSWDTINNSLDNGKELFNNLNCLFSKTEQEFRKKIDLLFNDETKKECLKFLTLLLGNNNFYNKKEPLIYLVEKDDGTTVEEQFDYNNKENVLRLLSISGLAENLFINTQYNDINSYLFGLKVGLSSHDKKNKSGRFMSEAIAGILSDKGIKYSSESWLNKYMGSDVLVEDKRFDYSFEINGVNYFLECNFFNDSGSKLNSELPRFIRLNDTLKKFKNVKFIYVGDGPGLRKSKELVLNGLNNIEYMFNLYRFKKFIIKKTNHD